MGLIGKSTSLSWPYCKKGFNTRLNACSSWWKLCMCNICKNNIVLAKKYYWRVRGGWNQAKKNCWIWPYLALQKHNVSLKRLFLHYILCQNKVLEYQRRTIILFLLMYCVRESNAFISSLLVCWSECMRSHLPPLLMNSSCVSLHPLIPLWTVSKLRFFPALPLTTLYSFCICSC